MLFQTLDDKKKCIAVYVNDQITSNVDYNKLSKTWSYSSFLKGKNIEYANLYTEGKDLETVCPEELKQEWQLINAKLRAVINSIFQSKISLKENCFYDLAPKHIVKRHAYLKNKITEHVFNTYKKPIEYNFYSRFNELLDDIKYRELNIDLEPLKVKIANKNYHDFYKKMLDTKYYIDYNMFGTITGRLTVEKNSFPIHTFPKIYREILKPQNDWFVSFDMNAAELRTSLALIEKNLPDEDLHEYIRRNIFNNTISRSESKQAVTAWLYNSNNELALKFNEELDNLFEKENILNTYWDGKYIYTPFSRKIESDKHNAISHLNQSTFIDLYHRQVLKIDDILKNCKSFISFLLHDEFILDMTNNEKESIIDIIKILQNTEFGKYLVNVKVGKNFGDMKKITLKV